MLETKQYPEYKELVSLARHWDYGSMHTHTEISQVMGVKFPSNRYYNLVQRAAEELLSCGKLLVCIKNEGYKILLPDEYVDQSVKCFEQGRRRLKKGLKTLNDAPVGVAAGLVAGCNRPDGVLEHDVSHGFGNRSIHSKLEITKEGES
jgi:hypothetical protein